MTGIDNIVEVAISQTLSRLRASYCGKLDLIIECFVALSLSSEFSCRVATSCKIYFTVSANPAIIQGCELARALS